jgi:hypothetical protein
MPATAAVTDRDDPDAGDSATGLAGAGRGWSPAGRTGEPWR